MSRSAQRRNLYRYEKIKEKKEKITIEELTAGFPEEFERYMQYCRSLKFEDKPCISDLRKLFKDLMIQKGYEYDFMYDWVIRKTRPQETLSGGSSQKEKDNKKKREKGEKERPAENEKKE